MSDHTTNTDDTMQLDDHNPTTTDAPLPTTPPTDAGVAHLLEQPPVDRPTVVHKDDEHDRYIGRWSGENFSTTDDPDHKGFWGNPNVLGHDAGVEQRHAAVASFRTLVVDRVVLPRDAADERVFDALRDLEGQRLGCWCRHDADDPTPGNRCHGDALAELVAHAVRGTFAGPADPERWPRADEAALAAVATAQVAMDRSYGMVARDAAHAALLAAHRHADPPPGVAPEIEVDGDGAGGSETGRFEFAVQQAAGDVADRRDDPPERCDGPRDDYRADVFAVARGLVDSVADGRDRFENKASEEGM